MTITEERGSNFSKKGYLEKNIDGLIDTVIDKSDKSINILVLGRPGSGKSSLDLFLSRYVDPSFDLDNVAFTHNQWYDKCRDLPKKEIVVHSEGRNSYNRLKANTNNFQEGQDIVYQWRFKNHLRLIEFQHLRHFNEELLKEEFHGIIRCFYPESRHKPFCHFYSKGRIKKIKIDNKNKKVSFPDPNFRDEWPNPEKNIPEFWNKYDSKNEEKLREEDEDVEDDVDASIQDVKRDTKLGFVKDLYRNGWSTREIASLDSINKSQSTIAEWVKDVQKGDRSA